MTAHTSEKAAVQHPETGWAEARRREKGVRTCVPALEEGGGPQPGRRGAESNIVRGED